MQHQVMGYDRAATMFAPDGHILQVEYAEKTIRLGSASIGIVCTDGVVIISDKRVKDKLVIQKSANKVYEVDSHIMACAAGIVSDARVLIERAQLLAQQHRITYDSPIEPELIIKEIRRRDLLYDLCIGSSWPRLVSSCHFYVDPEFFLAWVESLALSVDDGRFYGKRDRELFSPGW